MDSSARGRVARERHATCYARLLPMLDRDGARHVRDIRLAAGPDRTGGRGDQATLAAFLLDLIFVFLRARRLHRNRTVYQGLASLCAQELPWSDGGLVFCAELARFARWYATAPSQDVADGDAFWLLAPGARPHWQAQGLGACGVDVSQLRSPTRALVALSDARTNLQLLCVLARYADADGKEAMCRTLLLPLLRRNPALFARLFHSDDFGHQVPAAQLRALRESFLLGRGHQQEQ